MFGKIVSTLTTLAALWGAVLSTVIYLDDRAKTKPDMAVSLSIVREKGNNQMPKDRPVAKFIVNVMNLGESNVELSPKMTVFAHNSIDNSVKTVHLQITDQDQIGTFKDDRLHGYLKPGEKVTYISGEYDFNEYAKLYNTHHVILESEKKSYLATIVPPKSGALNHNFMMENEELAKYPMNLTFSPQKVIEVY